MNRIRVTLVRPPVDVLHKFSKPVENLAIAYLAASLRRDGHEVMMLDGMLHHWSEEETARNILASRPDLVGVTVVLQYFPLSIQVLARLLRDGGYGGPIIVGGHSVSFFPERILERVPELDGIVQGEGEQAIRDIAQAIAAHADWRTASGLCVRQDGSFRHNGVRRIRDLDENGDAARDLTAEIIERDGLVAVSTSRGCYARCSFCSIPRFYGLERGRALASGDWLARSVDGAVGEMAGLHERFGVRELLIVDDEFFGGTDAGRERALRIGRSLEERGLPMEFALSCRAENVDEHVFSQLRRGGLAHVFIGLEAGTEPALKLYGKGHSPAQNRRAVDIVKRLGLSFQPGFMLFHHRSTLSEIRANLDFLREIGECKPVTINSAVEPHFGTPLVRDMESCGALVNEALSLHAGYLDWRVAVLKKIAELCAQAFVPFMNFLAGVRSSVTYEWRRRVPGRQPAEEHLLDQFEASANDGFAAIVGAAADALERHPAVDGNQVMADAQARVDDVVERLTLARAILIMHLERVEGGIRYLTQRDLIHSECTVSASFERNGSGS